ncbi:hypothetical protein Tco_0425113 [Tanacetum coccineum]
MILLDLRVIWSFCTPPTASLLHTPDATVPRTDTRQCHVSPSYWSSRHLLQYLVLTCLPPSTATVPRTDATVPRTCHLHSLTPIIRSATCEPLSPDCVFDFPVDEPEPHPAYDFFAPGPLLGYAGNPNNNNGWIKADVPLLGELGVVADEPMIGLIVDEILERIVEAEEQVIAPVVDMDEDIAMLFGDIDFEDDDSKGFDKEEVWEVNEEWMMASVTPPQMTAVPSPSIYEVGVIEDLSTRLGNLENGHGKLVKKVIHVSDAEVTAGIYIGEIGLKVFAVERQGQQTATQRDEVIDGLTQQVQALQGAVQQRDSQI